MIIATYTIFNIKNIDINFTNIWQLFDSPSIFMKYQGRIDRQTIAILKISCPFKNNDISDSKGNRKSKYKTWSYK